MSPAVHIRARLTEKGKRRYQVRYRLGGRGFRLVHAGSFETIKEARARRDLVAGELAAGRDPQGVIRALQNPQQPRTWLGEFDRFIASRHDVGTSAKSLYRNARDKLGTLADKDPGETTVADIEEWVAANVGLAPKTIAHYLSSIRQVGDFCDLTPNPARSPRVKVPSDATAEPAPPSGDEWTRIKAKLTGTKSTVCRLCEADALRISEALELEWGDVDLAEGRIRISRARTKGRTAGQRWLRVPDQLLDELEHLCPLEDRHRDRRVFENVHDWQIRQHLTTACKLAGAAHYSPHDLRHRRISLWFACGIDAVTVKTWAGHARASMSLDTYAHVLVGGDEWRDFWIGVYRTERLPSPADTRPREAPVRPGTDADD